MNLDVLLAKIEGLNKKYEEIYTISGENFNIFNILRLTSDEISHSLIISSLLNPMGNHGKGDIFLKHFLETINIEFFISKGAKVETEKFIGYITKENDGGGKIDIFITDKNNNQIIIENKIYAKDQYKQLFRYNKEYPNAHILYLTLFGNEASEYSTGKDYDFKYDQVSYKEHIIKWLELCKKESIDKPILRETLTQYILLIKQLTGQARSKEMQKEYLEIIIQNAENVSAAFTISQSINDIKEHIVKEKFIPAITEVAKKLDMVLDYDDIEGCFNSYWGFTIRSDKWNIFTIDFVFESKNLHYLFYGFEKNKDKKIPKEFEEYLRNLNNYEHDETWPIWKRMDKYRDWDKDFFIEIMLSDEEIKKVFEEKIIELTTLATDSGFEL